jgi:hypothetical protein
MVLPPLRLDADNVDPMSFLQADWQWSANASIPASNPLERRTTIAFMYSGILRLPVRAVLFTLTA